MVPMGMGDSRMFKGIVRIGLCLWTWPTVLFSRWVGGATLLHCLVRVVITVIVLSMVTV